MVEQPTRNWWMSPVFRGVCFTYFLTAGLALVLLMTFAAPSFGYYVCSILFAASAIGWKSPRYGAAFSFPLVAVFGYCLVVIGVWRWHGDRATAVGLIAIVLFAFVQCSIVLVLDQIAWKPMALAATLVLVSFAVDRLWTNKVEIRSVEMGWTTDGKTPWGEGTQLDSAGKPPIILYVQAGGGYCYDAVFYEPLKLRLEQLGKPKVVVQYNVFKDFGSERGYNIRSIEGFQFNDAKHELIQYGEGYGGTMLVPSNDGRRYGPPTCPR